MGSARKCVGRDGGGGRWSLPCGRLGGRACWAPLALLDSPDAGAPRRGGRRRCQFELFEGEEGVIGQLVAGMGRVDRLWTRDKHRRSKSTAGS